MEPGACIQPGGPGSNDSDNDIVMDINDESMPFIPNGYQSDNNNPPCICGQELLQIAANKAYEIDSKIQCDSCNKSCNGNVCQSYIISTHSSIDRHIELFRRFQYFIAWTYNQSNMRVDMVFSALKNTFLF